jgi:hypothetical protein
MSITVTAIHSVPSQDETFRYQRTHHICSSPSPPLLPPEDLKKLRMSYRWKWESVKQFVANKFATQSITLWVNVQQMVTHHGQRPMIAMLASASSS